MMLPLTAGSALEAVGISATEERVYRALLGRPRATLGDVALLTGLTRPHVHRALASLETSGLVSSTPGRTRRFVAAPPELAVEGLIHQRRGELEQARLASVALAEEFAAAQPSRSPIELVEVVTGEEALRQRYVQLQRSAKREVVIFDRPPYALSPGSNEFELEGLGRGVRYRVIYAAAALEFPGQIQFLEQHRNAGEEARVLPNVPIKLAIADDRLGLVALHSARPALEGAVLVHASSLLDALTSLFEICWERAVPLTAAQPHGEARTEDLDDADRRLLTLLMSGVKDEVIARQLGLGVRTVRRRVAALMQELGASTRLQAGFQVAKKGWL